jgi:broad specificity phosphatase PhoE
LSIIKDVPTVLLVRHGQASFGAEDYDVLSPAGVRQSALLAASLRRRGVEPSRLVSGTLRRQTETAAAFATLGEPELDERWNEYDANHVLASYSPTGLRLDGQSADEQEGLTSKRFQAILEPALSAWIATDGGGPGGQSWADFSGGANAALAELGAGLGRGETGVAFTSGGTIAAICAALIGAPGAAFIALNRTLVNTGVTKVVIGAAGASLVSVNDHSHLEEADRALITYR